MLIRTMRMCAFVCALLLTVNIVRSSAHLSKLICVQEKDLSSVRGEGAVVVASLQEICPDARALVIAESDARMRELAGIRRSKKLCAKATLSGAGLHYELRVGIHAKDSTFQAEAYHVVAAVPREAYASPYELSALANEGRMTVSQRQYNTTASVFWGTNVDLESPSSSLSASEAVVHARVTRWEGIPSGGSRTRHRREDDHGGPGTDTYWRLSVSIPLHARYHMPSERNGHYSTSVQIPEPLVFVETGGDAEALDGTMREFAVVEPCALAAPPAHMQVPCSTTGRTPVAYATLFFPALLSVVFCVAHVFYI